MAALMYCSAVETTVRELHYQRLATALLVGRGDSTFGTQHVGEGSPTIQRQRSRGSMERDFEYLRRKFMSLYTKQKPTGRGEVSARNRPVVWAIRIQAQIETEGGVQTTHDGQDEGGDDEVLLRDVDDGRQGETSRVPLRGGAGTGPWPLLRAGLRPLRRENPGSDTGVDGGANIGTNIRVSTVPDVAGLQAFRNLLNVEVEPGHGDTPGDRSNINTTPTANDAAPEPLQHDSQPPPPPTGVILTDHEPVDATLAHHYDFLDDDNGGEAEREQSDTTQEVSAAAYSHASVDLVPLGEPVETQAATLATPFASPPGRSTSRPKKQKRKPTSSRIPLPTVASPGGPTLQRDPRMAEADAREMECYGHLDIGSNRLGGQGL
ncbi:hypothetical protein PHMEG_0008409 [Phytophthora megakarya]|uniref:DUF6818 domain-containing protein n=1 Tax=Phytophthora megakarya TaxID=4795 RepID=A0A225WJN3_9STRA|nr:hypothetical protein PHMEG_0008409 [Phytophthora megakarya]